MDKFVSTELLCSTMVATAIIAFSMCSVSAFADINIDIAERSKNFEKCARKEFRKEEKDSNRFVTKHCKKELNAYLELIPPKFHGEIVPKILEATDREWKNSKKSGGIR